MEDNQTEQNINFKNFIYANHNYRNSINSRKKLLSDLLEKFIIYKNKIAQVNEECYQIEDVESNFLEILPVIVAFKTAISKLDSWSATNLIETNSSLHQKTFSTYTPKGLVSIFIKTPLPFYYVFNTLISAIAAGNKAIIQLQEYPEQVLTIIKNIIESVVNNSDIAVLSSKQKIDQSFKTLKFDYYTFICDESSFKKYSANIEDSSTINFLNNSNYKSCVIIDESTTASQKMDKLLYSGFIHGGELYFNNHLFLVHVDKINEVKKSIAEIQKKINHKDKNYFIKPFYKADSENSFNTYSDILKKVLKDKNSEILLIGESNEDALEMQPSIIQISPKTELWKMTIKGPIILLLPFYNIKDAIHHLQKMPLLNKVHLFSKNKFNINAVTSNLEAELFLINELFMDRYNLNTINSENKALYKGISGYANFSNLKTVMIKKQQSNFEKLLFKKMDFISKKWFEIFFYKH